jgi:hypothetical protein
MREELHTVQILCLFCIGRDVKFREDGEALIYSGGAIAEGGCEGVAVPAKKVCEELCEFIIVCWAFVEGFDGCADNWDVDNSGDACGISTCRVREGMLCDAGCV